LVDAEFRPSACFALSQLNRSSLLQIVLEACEASAKVEDWMKEPNEN
jgi:hypothetical protein